MNAVPTLGQGRKILVVILLGMFHFLGVFSELARCPALKKVYHSLSFSLHFGQEPSRSHVPISPCRGPKVR